MLIITLFLTSFVNEVSAANSATCETYGFEVDKDVYRDIGWTSFLVNTCYLGNVIIGTSNTKVFFATQKQKVGDKNMNVAFYYTVMNPKKFTAKGNDGITRTYTGKSDYLRITTKLPKASQQIQVSYPESVSEMTQYTLGASVGVSGENVVGNISASTVVTKKRLEIHNHTDIDNGVYDVEYDYVTALLGTDKTNSYLKDTSVQRGSFYYTTDGNCFTFPATITTRFGYYYGILHYDSQSSMTTYFRIAIA